MKLFKQIFLFGIVFIGVLFLCEIFIQSAHISSVSSTEFYEDIGRGRRKDLKYLYFNEGFGVGKFNTYRYLGENRSPEKSANSIRVALMGDSYVESFQVFQRDYFGTIAEIILQGNYPNKKIEILNFGRSGFNIGDIYAYQQTFVNTFNPDLILYFISEDDLNVSYSDALRPKTIINNNEIQVDLNFNQKKINSFENTKLLVQNSVIFNMLNNGRKKSNHIPILEILFEKVYYWFKPATEILETNKNEQRKSDLNPIGKKILESLDSNKTIIINKKSTKFSEEFLKLCQTNYLKIIEIEKAFDSLKQSGIEPLEWKVTKKKGHWNPAAHKALGKELAKNLKIEIDSLNK